MATHHELANFIWQIADLLRGPYRPPQYERVMLPFVVLRNVPLKENELDYFTREVLPHVPDAWFDAEKTKIGYEINFNRQFYVYTPPRPLAEIDADLKKAEEEILRLLKGVTE
jgi:type I restriction-modification system DNA methylase subunit